MQRKSSANFLLSLVFFAFLLAAYLVIRYEGTWMDGDTSQMITITDAVLKSATIEPPENAYYFGYNYPVFALIFSIIIDVDIQEFFVLLRPFLVVIIPLAAIIYFRQVFIADSQALLATLILFLQPELLFVSLRGSHEVLTWSYVLLALFLLTKSRTATRSPAKALIYILLFYLVIYALISTSVFFASSFLFGLIVSFVLGIIVEKWFLISGEDSRETIFNRLQIIIWVCSILIFLFIFNIYATATQPIALLKMVTDKIFSVLFGLEIDAYPYISEPQTYGEFIASTWVSPAAYIGLTMANWITLILSFIAWIQIGYKRIILREYFDWPIYLLWLLYAAFAFQLVLSFIADYAGVLSGNLQIRLFPPFILTAVPLASKVVSDNLKKISATKAPKRAAYMILIAMSITWLGSAAILKATSEPLLSNKWSFYTKGEDVGLIWMHNYINNGHVWISPDERLREISKAITVSSNNHFTYDIYYISRDTRYVFWSNVNEMLAERLKLNMPPVEDKLAIYSNGDAIIFKVRPGTIFEK